MSPRDYTGDAAEDRERAEEKNLVEVRDVSVPAETPPVPAQIYAGASLVPFEPKVVSILRVPVVENDVEIRPDGLVYLPEIKYRRILNDAFQPGGWALLPHGSAQVIEGVIMREWGLYVGGRFVAATIGEAEYQPDNPNYSYATAHESAKSNALMRCCKDIEPWKEKNAIEVWCEDRNGRKKPLWRRRDAKPFEYPYREQGAVREEGGYVEDKTIAPDFALEDGGVLRVKSVDEKAGKSKKSGKDYVMYRVTFSDGSVASTFDKGLAMHAAECMRQGSQVEPDCEKSPFGLNLHNLRVVMDRPGSGPLMTQLEDSLATIRDLPALDAWEKKWEKAIAMLEGDEAKRMKNLIAAKRMMPDGEVIDDGLPF